MSELSPRLSLPFLQPAQAQKHVTHNEALEVLDGVVQLSVASRTESTPPASPGPLARHIVPAGATGSWAGQTGRVAVWQQGGWVFLAPRTGWLAWVEDEGQLVVRQGADWGPVPGAAGGQGSFETLGVNAGADSTNRLSVAAEATLLNHAGAGHQLKINKAASAQTASLLFQSGFSGRAEMGLAGNDDFAIKTSSDGTAFQTALSVTAATGVPDLAAGATVGGHVACHRGNLLGTVGQSGGQPTGAVIESGGDANGQFLRLADGSQICWITTLSAANAATAMGALFRSSDVGWTFPQAFATPPVVSGQTADTEVWVTAATPSASACSLRAVAAVSKGAAVGIRAVAVGRWF
ncbi:MAG: DUF2793 domain-containing protein [Rubellimicrobium sp.]|nr:DUF2793 domain-containing protein [Rubellimicrobium sp.]